jgi:hypothetical protein
MPKIVIHQPNLFPRLKVLKKIASADIWVIFDDVQFVKREWQNRTKLRLLNQPSHQYWLTVPVNCPSGQHTLIKNVVLAEPNRFYAKLVKTFQYTYGDSKHWNWINSYLNICIESKYEHLSEFCTNSTMLCFQMLNIESKHVNSSFLDVPGKSTDKLAGICKLLNGNIYISGSGGHNYLDLKLMHLADIQVEWQNWTEPVTKDYKYSNLSWRNYCFLDYLARFGPEETKKHLINSE